MNSLCNIAKDTSENAMKTLDREHTQTAKTIHVLSVGPVDCGSMVHDALLGGSNFRLTITADYRKLWETSTQESIQVAILHNTLSAFESEAVCRLIRRRWPHTRILVISNRESILEDALYDDRVALAVAPEVLLEAIERLTGE
jgi:hypothetical protein